MSGSHVDKWCRYGQRSHMVYVWMKKWGRSEMCSGSEFCRTCSIRRGEEGAWGFQANQIQPIYFCTTHDLRMDFTFFNSWEKIKRNLSFWNLWKLCENFLVHLTEDWLEHSPLNCYVLSNDCLHSATAGLTSCDRGRMSGQASSISHLAFYRKRMLT